MDSERINAVLPQATDTRNVTIGPGVLASVNELFTQCFGNQSAVVIADSNTWTVAGETVYQCLVAAGRSSEKPFVFPGQPTLYAEYQHIVELEAALRMHDAIPVAVGSGTLNDLVKLAAHRCDRPYMVVATAASMDGYTSFGAPITRDGFKQTFGCAAPRAVLADLDILAHAPLNMTASGYGDLLGKVTAGADWILADGLEIEPIDRRAWPLVQDSLRAWTAQPQLLRTGDRQAIADLVEGLILTGLAMQIAQSSRPASGCEHLLAHLWEMQEQTHGAVSHGFKVALGTIASAALYEPLLRRDFNRLDIPTLCRAWPSRSEVEAAVRQAHASPALAEKAVEQSLAKYIDAEQLRQRLMLIRERWPALRERLAAQLMTAEQLRGLLHAAGCPVEPSEIGITPQRLKESYHIARQIRSRYTVFDLATETGCLSPCIDELFAPGGFWFRAVPAQPMSSEAA
jgi:glycerol-1-phosphate dehydrogenase [NAD(P)+]